MEPSSIQGSSSSVGPCPSRKGSNLRKIKTGPIIGGITKEILSKISGRILEVLSNFLEESQKEAQKKFLDGFLEAISGGVLKEYKRNQQKFMRESREQSVTDLREILGRISK